MFGFEFYYKIAMGLKSLIIFEFSRDKVYKRKEVASNSYIYEIKAERCLYPKEDTKEPYYLELTSFQFGAWTGETLNDIAKEIFPLILARNDYKWE